jgi:hypothetical protein
VQQPPPQLPTQAEMASRVQLPDWLGGAALWIVLGLVGGYLLLNYLRAHGLLKGSFLERLTFLRYWWHARRAALGEGVQAGVAALRARLRRGRVGGLLPARRPRINPNRLPAREKVRYFYLAAVERAHERGQERPPHKTPLEFEDDLEAAWPDAEGDMRALTEAFVDARYTSHDIAPDQASSIQLVWRRVMATLRKPVGGEQIAEAGQEAAGDDAEFEEE